MKKRIHFDEILNKIIKKELENDPILRPLRMGKKKDDSIDEYNKNSIDHIEQQRIEELSRILTDTLIYGKRRYDSGAPWEYSFTEKELTDIFGKKNGKRIHKDLLGKFFTIIETGNSHQKKTHKFVLRKEYRKAVLELDTLTIYNKEDIPKSGLDISVRKKLLNRGGDTIGDLNNYVVVNKNSLEMGLYVIRRHLDNQIISHEDFLKYVIGDEKSEYTRERIEEYHKDLSILRSHIHAKELETHKPTLNTHYTPETINKDQTGTSGRLYNRTGMNSPLDIQNVKRPIKEILLSGMGLYDVDIINCHINLLNQYYKMIFGEENKELNTYCSSYEKIRDEIHQESGVRYSLIKQAIISLVYDGTYPSSAQIEKLIKGIKIIEEFKKVYVDESKTKKNLKNLFNSDKMTLLGTSIKTVIGEIYKENKKQGGRVFGRIYRDDEPTNQYENVAGYIMTPEQDKEKDKTLLSHTLTGMEVIALHHIIRTEHRDDLISLHHDGWVVKLGNRTPDGYKETTTHQLKTKTDEMMKEWVERRGIKLKLPGENKGWGFDLGLKPTPLDKKDKIHEKYRTLTLKYRLETRKP